MNKQEAQENLDHRQKVLGELRKRLKELEIREARYGFNITPESAIEIRELTERIRDGENEIQQLRTIIVEDETPLDEAEYRTLLAETWKDGRLNVVGRNKLELARLHLGITMAKAQLLEREIKRSLAIENFFMIPKFKALMTEGEINFIDDRFVTSDYDRERRFISNLHLGRAIFLDIECTLDLLEEYFIRKVDFLQTEVVQEDINDIANDWFLALSFVHNAWPNQEDFAILTKFRDEFAALMRSYCYIIKETQGTSPNTPAPVIPGIPLV